jgi:serine/threonine-protein kinase
MNVVLKVVAGPLTGKEYIFDRHSTFVVGRSPQAHFPVPDDKFLSRDHFLIEFNPPICFLKDMGSTNGTRVNGQRLNETRLRDGDTISAGKSTFVVMVDSTRELLSPILCTVCGCVAPDDIAVAAEPGEEKIIWICDSCVAQRRKFPIPPEGYWIESRLGGGGMGEVYKARHLESGRLVAIKMMIPSAAASPRARDYFRREVEVLKQLKHPHIVQFYGMDDDLGQFQLIMEYVDGPNAREWMTLHSEQPPVSSIARIGVQLLSALHHAHSKGFVHRDIKPSNLLVPSALAEPDVKLSDFGLAKSFRDDIGFFGLTHQGDIGGSVGFISPDHIRDFREVKEPADIYGAGATLYYLLCGQYPYLDFDPTATNAYTMILEYPSVPLRVHRPDVPEALDRIIRKSLEKQPRDRWKTAKAFAEALAPFQKTSAMAGPDKRPAEPLAATRPTPPPAETQDPRV